MAPRDGTAAVVEAYGDRVRMIRQEPIGQGSALNAGIENADGELISFLDADDLWRPRKLELQCEALDEDPGLDLVFGMAREFISPDLSDEERAELRARTSPAPAKLKGTMVIRRAALERAGPFEAGWRIAEFVEWYTRATDVGLREEMLDEVVLERRLHRTNIGRSQKDARVEYAAAMRAQIRRRRAREEN